MSNSLLSTEAAPAPAPVASDRGAAGIPDCPDWFRARQDAAWDRFHALAMPSRTDEEWRFSNLKQIDLETFHPAAGEARAPATVDQLEDPQIRLVFSDGQLVSREGDDVEGVHVMSLEQALSTCPELVEKHFMQFETPLGSEKFAALHLAHLRTGVFVHAGAGVVLEKPIEIIQHFTGDGVAYFPHTLVIGEENAQVTVVEQWFTGSDDDRVFLVGVNDLVASRGARVKYGVYQQLGKNSKAISINATAANRDADAKSLILNVGGSWVRNESVSHVTGEGANVNLLSASVPGSGQAYDQRTYQLHRAQHTRSDLVYKNAAFEKARMIFSGLIIVDEGAHFTDAYQTCRNLLMSDDAEVNCLPGLEINADEVRCSHGATAGQISDEELFYLLARGIREPLARKLITHGFLEEVFEKFENTPARELADRIIDRKFARLD